MLTVKEAQEELKIAETMNPGIWIQHCESVANNARLIAEKTGVMDPDVAYVFGLMHDIGRRDGFKGILHVFDGYEYMKSIGQDDVARICLTHSFPLKDADTFMGKYDCTPEQKQFLQDYLDSVEYNHYDVLIQLCDSISLPNGACIMEKRLMDVAMRHGITPFMIDKWKAFMSTKKYFDELCGCSIYTVLPNVLENSMVDLI